MRIELWVLVFGWALFGLLHSVTASNWFKQWAQSCLGHAFRYYRLFYALWATITLGALLFYQWQLSFKKIQFPLQLRYTAGLLMGIPGLALLGILLKKYFFHLTGLDIFWNTQTPNKLLTSGVHKWVRHPLYLGTLLVIWAWFFAVPTDTNLIACCMISLYTFIGMFLEEKKLLQEFGDAYHQYQQSVPMLIPFFPFTHFIQRIAKIIFLRRYK
jgi:protein-S-isoprenylcysteine O-methyltransferase Ste14